MNTMRAELHWLRQEGNFCSCQNCRKNDNFAVIDNVEDYKMEESACIQAIL